MSRDHGILRPASRKSNASFCFFDFFQTNGERLPLGKIAVSTDHSTDFHRAFRSCVNRLTKDTQEALGDLFDLTAVRLVRLAMSVTGSQMDAEDAVQGAYSRIAGKPKLLARADAPWPYLIRAVRNEAIRILQKRRTSSLGEIDAQSAQDSAESLLQREETAERVQRILKSLPKAQYEVVILKHWEELTFAEIADVLGKSQNTVASRYRYAMEKLQRSLEPVVQEPVTQRAPAVAAMAPGRAAR
ncbi:MAG: sigma-70 family RNA polymerase sigma factor [Fuerstiella sp.]